MAFIQKIATIQDRTPSAVVTVFPFRHKLLRGEYDATKAMQLDKPQFLEDRLISLSTMDTKKSPSGNLNVVLKDPDGKIEKTIAPGDWILAWLCNSAETAEYIRGEIRNLRPANDHDSGLKFIGKVASIGRSIQVDPNSGAIIKTISLTGSSFSEFESMIFFDPNLEIDQGPNAAYFFFNRISDGLTAITQPMLAKAGTMLHLLINIFLGAGPDETAKGFEEFKTTPNDIFLAPKEIGKILRSHKDGDSSIGLTYATMLFAMIGIQQFENGIYHPTSLVDSLPWVADDKVRRFDDDSGHTNLFLSPPKSQVTSSLLQFIAKEDSSYDLIGTFSGQLKPWSGVPIWSCMKSFLNETMNEMYTTLMVAPDSFIRPTLIARQIPFNYKEFKDKSGIIVTEFLSLPRWQLDSSSLIQANFTKSNNLRTNFVQITVVPPTNAPPALEIAVQKANTLGEEDRNDIVRSGTRMYVSHVNIYDSAFQDEDPSFEHWTGLVADRLMGLHLRWSGSVMCKGVQECVPVGDNLFIDDTVYHIEGVGHNINVHPQNGAIMWNTVFHLSNGVILDKAGKPVSEEPENGNEQTS